MVGRLKGGSWAKIASVFTGNSSLQFKIRLQNDEEVKVEVADTITVEALKKIIAKKNTLLPADSMCLTYAGVVLNDE